MIETCRDGGREGAAIGSADSYLKLVEIRRVEELQGAAGTCRIIAEMKGGEGLPLAVRDWQKRREWEEEIEGKGEAAVGGLELPENGRNGGG